jgi:hypothetical protein
MTRFILVLLLSVACASCETPPIHRTIWALSRTEANSNEVFLGGHYTLEACRKAALKWFPDAQRDNAVLQCRLNCQKMNVNGQVTCEATEPAG